MAGIYIIPRLVEKLRLRNFKKYHAKKLTHCGHSFDLFLSLDNGFCDQYIYCYGVHEPNILDLIAKYLKSGDVFIDIGAHIGQHGMFAASIVGPTGQVYSFEPIPHLYKQILDSIKINNFQNIIHPYNAALGVSDEAKTFYINPKRLSESSFIDLNNGDSLIKQEVTVLNGDKILGNLPKITMMKIDVEGYEYEVLLGLINSLKKHLPILIMEFSGKFYVKRGQDHGSKIILLLESLGYVLYNISDNMRVIDHDIFLRASNTEDGLEINYLSITNFLCVANK